MEGRMSWLFRSAVQRANLTRIRTYADTVVQHAGQAVAGGAKLIHGRISSTGSTANMQTIQQTVKRLEEEATSSKGEERVLMLRRWLDSLVEVEDCKKSLIGAEKGNGEGGESTQPTLVFYRDIDHEGEYLNFLEVFLRSEALEGIGLSMILDAPNDEEVALLLEIFGHCLVGGKEVHNVVVRNMQDLAIFYPRYQDEVLFKRDEMLQFAQSSISGMKINTNQARIDVEVTSLKADLIKEIHIPSGEEHNKSSQEVDVARTQAMKETLSQIRIYSKLKALLLRKIDALHGESPDYHAQKVSKLKGMLQSLANTSSKAKNRIEDHRRRKEEALSFRAVRATEVGQAETNLLDEIEKLQKKKDDLEAQLQEVNISLASANGRLQYSREERQHFDKASSEVFSKFQSKEKELLKSIDLCQTETDVASACIRFIESTWNLKCNVIKQKEEFTNAELWKYTEYFVGLAMQLFPAYKNELSITVKNFKDHAEKLHEMSYDGDENDNHLSSSDNEASKLKNKLQEEYHELEGKLLSAFSVVESIKQLLAQSEPYYKEESLKVQKLMEELQEVKDEFEAVDKPDLTVQTPTTLRWKRIAKKLAIRELPRKYELSGSKLVPREQKQKQQERVHSNNKNKQDKKYNKDPATDFQEVLDSEHLPEPRQKEEDATDTDNQYSNYSSNSPVIDGHGLLDTDDELTALEKDFVADIINNADQELNDWEV